MAQHSAIRMNRLLCPDNACENSSSMDLDVYTVPNDNELKLDLGGWGLGSIREDAVEPVQCAAI